MLRQPYQGFFGQEKDNISLNMNREEEEEEEKDNYTEKLAVISFQIGFSVCNKKQWVHNLII